MVDTPEEFDDLFAEFEDDWEDVDGDLQGEMDVEVVEATDASGEVTGQQRSSQKHAAAVAGKSPLDPKSPTFPPEPAHSAPAPVAPAAAEAAAAQVSVFV